MLRYRDSATGAATDCPGEWFDSHVVEGIRAFRVQSGFFRYAALAKYEGVLKRLASEDRTLSFVLGSNLTDPLTIEDVESVLAVMDGRASSHLTVVALRNALYHPKIFHVVRSDRSMAAMVGSANLTVAALGTNIEAWLEVESGDAQADRVLQSVAQALLAEGIPVDRETQRRSGAMFRSSMPARRSARQPRWISPWELPTRPKRRANKPTHPVAQGVAQRSCVGARSCLSPRQGLRGGPHSIQCQSTESATPQAESARRPRAASRGRTTQRRYGLVLGLKVGEVAARAWSGRQLDHHRTR